MSVCKCGQNVPKRCTHVTICSRINTFSRNIIHIYLSRSNPIDIIAIICFCFGIVQGLNSNADNGTDGDLKARRMIIDDP